MASPTIQFKRGGSANIGLASFKAGEPGFTTDKYDFYIGVDGTAANQQFFGSSRYWEREDGSNAAQLKFVDKNGSNSINFQAPNTLSGIGTWILPAYNAGAANEILEITSVSGNQITLDWVSNPADDLITLSGVAEGSTNLGTFTGSTISDSRTVKAALQDLETSLESVSGGGASATSVAVASTDANSTHYITFVDGNNASKTQEDIQTDAGIVYNPSTNLLTLSNLSIAGVAVTAILDEDDLTSDRADALATQQSIKAYVDNNSPASTVDISGDTGTASVSTGATFAFTGTDPVVIAASGAGVTFSISDAAADGSTKGIAAFNADDFDASSGVITLGDSANGAVLAISATNNETTVSRSNGTVTIGLPDDVTIGQDLTVTRNLYVNGSTTQVNVDTLTVDDPLIAMGTTSGSAPAADFAKDLGILMHYYSESAKLSSVYWDNSAGRMVMASVVTESNNVLTALSHATVEIGSLMLSDAAGTAESVITVSGSDRVLQNIIVDAGTF